MLQGAISRVIHAASPDRARPNISAIHIGGGAVVATDGHRMSMLECEETSDWPTMNVPLRLAELIAAMESPEFRHEDGYLLAVDGPAMIGGKLSTATFPPYRAVMPKREAAKTVATVNRAELLGVLRAAMDLSEAKTRMVRLSIGDGRIAIESRNEHGELTDAVDCSVSGPALQIAANAGYLVEGLAACEGETVELAMQGELDPITISDGTGLVEVVMPVRS